MPLDSSIREFLLDPALAGTLSVPLDQFVLHARNGDIELAAHLRCNPEGKGFILELRDDEGRDISEFFEQKNHYSEDDGVAADGWLDGRFPIQIARLFRPESSNRTLFGLPKASRATFNPSRIRIPPDHTDHLPDELDSTSEALGARPYSHVAIFKNTNLMMVNKGVKEKRLHPFLGETSKEREEVWIGEALGGEYCLHQAGDHLEIHFRHRDVTDDEAMTRFWCLIDAVSFVHAILPWPTFRQHRRDGTLLERELALHGKITQGRFVQFRKQDTYSNPTAGQLLKSLATLLFDSRGIIRERIKRLLWVFRGSDTNSAPFPTQLIGVCTVIEGLVELLLKDKVQAPADFLTLRTEASNWAAARFPENPHAKRLAGYIKGWHYQDRRTSWHAAFDPLFPDKPEWLNELFVIFNKYRHGLAHGNFDGILTDDSHGDLQALSRLAGFVNLVFAAMSGFEGRLLEAPFGDKRIELCSSGSNQLQISS
jgi:hypothetical protein